MLTIRKPQIEALGDDAYRRYLRRLGEHLRAHFPEQLAPLDEETLRGLLHRGIARARALGIESERGCSKFLHLVVSFGEGFESARPWAQAVLGDTEGSSRPVIDRLHDEALRHQEELTAGVGQA